MDRQAFQRAWGKVMARAWADAAFKERLLAAPEAVFQEYGFEVPSNILIRVVSNSDRMIQPPVYPSRRPRMVRGVHLILLPQARDELSDAGLEHVAGGLDRGSNHLRGGQALKGTAWGIFRPTAPWLG